MSDFIPAPISRVVPNTTGEYNHQFGGPAYHRGSTPAGASRPIHLLYVLDCRDPLVPISIPNVTRLPLYYDFQYDASALGYRVISDDEIEILYIERPNSYDPDFPYDNYPVEFPKVPVDLTGIDSSDYHILRHFIQTQYARFDASVADKCEELSEGEGARLEELGYPFSQLGGEHLMWQGIPQERCPNPKCENHNDLESLGVFAVVWDQPLKGVFLWGDDPELQWDLDVQIIFQICPLCHCILASNRCT